jgi:hypothetical protein
MVKETAIYPWPFSGRYSIARKNFFHSGIGRVIEFRHNSINSNLITGGFILATITEIVFINLNPAAIPGA